MNFVFSLSFKNLFRYKRRTIITSIALAVGVMMFIYVDSFLKGLEKESDRNIIWYESGSAKIMDKTYVEEKDFSHLEYVIEEPEKVENLLDEAGYDYTRRTTFGGEIFFGEGYTPIKVIAIDTQTDENVFHLKETIQERGRYLEYGKYEIILGEWLAQDLKTFDGGHADIGDTVLISTKTRFGASQTLELEIVGIINSPNPMINKGTAFIPLSIMDELMQMEGAVTEIAIAFPEWKNLDKKIDAIRPQLEAQFPELTIQSWKDMATDYIAITKAKTAGSSIIIFLIFIIAAVGIANTMMMAVFERVKEIGMMRAMGMKDSSILLSFILEAGGIGIIGSIFGLILGIIVNYIFVEYGWDLTEIYGGQMDIGYRIYGIFHSTWVPSNLILSPILGTLFCMFFAIFPARRALKMEITTALRFE